MKKVKSFFLFIPRNLKRFGRFLKDVKGEMKLVKWSTWKELAKYTKVVLLIGLFLTAYFIGLDYCIEFVKGFFS